MGNGRSAYLVGSCPNANVKKIRAQTSERIRGDLSTSRARDKAHSQQGCASRSALHLEVAEWENIFSHSSLCLCRNELWNSTERGRSDFGQGKRTGIRVNDRRLQPIYGDRRCVLAAKRVDAFIEDKDTPAQRAVHTGRRITFLVTEATLRPRRSTHSRSLPSLLKPAISKREDHFLLL
jgi:hypothetical protein